MKKLITLSLLLLASSPIFSQSPTFDQELATKMGADEYGMKSYVFVMIESGEYTPASKEEQSKLFQGHQENIRRLAEEGKLVLAGPFYPNDEGYRGLFILDVTTEEEATKLMETDPAIASDVLAVKFYPWYGSAALPVYLETHKKIAKKDP